MEEDKKDSGTIEDSKKDSATIKDVITIEDMLTTITSIGPAGHGYSISVKEPEGLTNYINSIILPPDSIGFIVNAYDDILGKPAELALLGKYVVAYYDDRNGIKHLYAIKPLPLDK